MITKNIFTAVFFFLFGSAIAFASGTDQIKDFCKNEWTKSGTLDQQMFNYCLKRQAESVGEIKSVQTEFKGQKWFENLSGPNCFKKWTKRDVPNYEMIAHCMKSEKEGYLDTKYQYDKKDKSVAIDCVINKMASETPMEMSAYCIKNYSPSEKSRADTEMARFAESNPNVKDVKAAREMVDTAFFGKQNKPEPSTMPQLPDVANLVPPPQPASQKAASAESNQGPGMMDKVKGWFASSGGKSSSDCPEEKAQANFIATCKAAMEYNAMTGNSRRNPAADNSLCRCIALNFSVERVAKLPACDFSFQDVYAMKRLDKVYVKCGE